MDFKTEIKEEPLLDSKEEVLQQNLGIKLESEEDCCIQLSSDNCVVKLHTIEAPENDSSSIGDSLFNFKVEPQLESSASPTQVFIKSESTEGFYGESNAKMCNTMIELPEVKSGLCSGGEPIHLDCPESSSVENENEMAVLGHLIPIQVQTLHLPPGVYPINSISDCALNLREKSSKQCNSHFQCPESFNSTEESVVDSLNWVTEPNVKEEVQEPSYQCGECTKKFNAMDEFEEHMTVHSPHKCPICSKNYESVRQLNRHIPYHRKIMSRMIQCPHCPEKFRTRAILKTHLLSHNNYSRFENNFSCGQCSRTFSSQAGIQEHWKLHVPQFPCPLCARFFQCESDLKLHFSKKHSVKNPMYNCAHCTERFDSVEGIRNHLEVHFENE